MAALPGHLRLSVLATLASLVCALVPASAANAANERYRDRVGLGTHLRYERPAEVQSALRQLREGGVTWVREDFNWNQAEPIRGTYDWRLTDNLMAGAAAEGVDVLALIDYSASWASSDPSGGGDQFHPPSDFADYAAFARRVVERYGRGGTFWSLHPELTPRPLRAVEVWNEPYGRWFWKPDPDPAAYARMVRATAAAVRAADPQVQVLAAGDLLEARSDGRIVGWLDSLLDADPGLGDVIDAWSVHPYPGPRNLGPGESPKPQHAFARVLLSKGLAAARGAGKPFWITEIGWSTGPGDPEGISEERQADFTRGAVERAIRDWGVERVFVYSWGRSKEPREQRDYALRRADGSPRPAWDALRDLIGGAEPAPPAAPQPAAAAPAPPAPAGGAPPARAKAAKFRVAMLKQPAAKVARRGVAVRVTCTARCALRLEVRVRGKRSVAGKKRVSLRAARPVTVRVPLASWLRKRLRDRAKVGVVVRAALQR